MSGKKEKGNYNEWQGKTREQVRFSTMMSGLSMVAMIGKDKWEYQGKTKEQVRFSTMMAGLSIVAMIALILVSWIMKVIN